MHDKYQEKQKGRIGNKKLLPNEARERTAGK